MHTTIWGITFSSEIDLPGTEPIADVADVTIRFGEVPTTIEDVRSEGVAYQAAPGTFLSRVPGVASYLIEDGTRITVAQDPATDPDTVRLLLMGTPMGALLHQRRRVPLHASAVEVDGKAVLFAGHSSFGKSALAAAFHDAGHRVIADDICAVSVAENGSIVADVGPIELLLWFDTLSQLGHDPANLRRARPELEKYRYPVLVADGPRAIDRLLVLAPASRETADAGIIEPFARMRLLLDHTRGSGYLEGLGAGPSHFRTTTGTAAHVSMSRVPCALDSSIETLCERVTELLDLPATALS